MILSIIKKNQNNDTISYKADINEFEAVYKLLESEDYSNVKDLALEQIEADCLDPRYVLYAEFGYWYESTNFNINYDVLKELISIHQFYLEKIDEDQIRLKPYIKILDWLHSQMFKHAEFIKKDVDIYFEGDKPTLDKAFDEYISFIKSEFEDINIAQLYQVKDLFKTFRIKEVEIEEAEAFPANESSEILPKDITVSNNVEYGNDQWSKLLRDIQIYRKLVNDESWLKAAVVYQVINTTLKEFDPVNYFPETFYPYLKDTANAYDHLTHQLSLSEHPLWSMLSSMFESEPESFSADESLGAIGEILTNEVNNLQHQQSPEMQSQDQQMLNDGQDRANW
ncbi:type VI secretion system protein IglI family protein [Francisellaceae bacterium CB300]|jgi:hypothetical protein